MFRKCLRAGLTAVVSALLVRLFSSDIPARAVAFLSRPDSAAFLIYVQTGRDVRSSFSDSFVWNAESPPPVTEPAPVAEPVPEPSYAQAAQTAIRDLAGKCPNLALLACRPLKLETEPGAPAVLLLSTHTTESYTQSGEGYAESAAYRTLDEGYNMLSVDALVAQELQAQGIEVLLDTALHDYPSYNGSYNHARKAVAAALREHPEICMVLDLHRDAAGGEGAQLRTLAQVAGQDSAQLMLVVGSNGSGLQHDGWEDNLALALKLQYELACISPGITRPISLRAQRFNQDLSPGFLLVEVGAAGNTRAEALRAGRILAQGVGALFRSAGAID